MNIVDAVIILIILCGAVVGFKRGVIKETVMTVGFLLIFILSFYFQKPISSWMGLHLPFFNFGGAVQGVTVLNIILYQLLGFTIVFSILMVVFKIVLTISGIIEKILKFTIILGIPSKILGAVVGAIEGFVISFLVVFLLNQPMLNVGIMDGSKFKDKVLNVPILNDVVSSVTNSATDVYKLIESGEYTTDKEAFNRNSLDIMLKYKVVDVKYIEKLIDYGKIRISGVDSVLNKYR